MRHIYSFELVISINGIKATPEQQDNILIINAAAVMLTSLPFLLLTRVCKIIAKRFPTPTLVIPLTVNWKKFRKYGFRCSKGKGNLERCF